MFHMGVCLKGTKVPLKPPFSLFPINQLRFMIRGLLRDLGPLKIKSKNKTPPISVKSRFFLLLLIVKKNIYRRISEAELGLRGEEYCRGQGRIPLD